MLSWAATEAGDLAEQQLYDQHRALALELEQVNYQAALAARCYEAVDPDNRLVAAELEARWKGALQRVAELEALRAKGRPIPTNDMWIAAHAMETGAELLSFDQHFEAVDGLAWVPLSRQ